MARLLLPAVSFSSPRFLAAGVLALLCASIAGCGFLGGSLPFLRAEGTRIVDDSGNEVYLWGVNLGNWLLVEPWMLKMDKQAGVAAGKDIFDILEKRFGADAGRSLYRTYVDNFITEDDIAYIASTGMNFIRVPFWYGAVFDPKYTDAELEDLDRVIGWAKKHDLYVLIDLHGAPGGQNTGVNILGENVSNMLWSSDANKEKTIQIWQRLAYRYKDEPTVAGYDLLNEAWGAPRMQDLVDFYDVLYKKIREIDPHHMIFIEDGLKGLHRLPHPKTMGWENIVYSFHFYPGFGGGQASEDAFAEQLPNMRRAQYYFGVPFHCGEFNSISIQNGGVSFMLRYMEVFRRYGWSWNFWSYKKIEDNRDINWALVGTVERIPSIDLQKITEDETRSLFESYNTEALGKNHMMEAILRQHAEDLSNASMAGRAANDLVLYPEEAWMWRGKPGAVRLQWGLPEPNFGYWSSNDAVLWLIEVPEDGVYEVRLDYSTAGKRPTFELYFDLHRYGEIPLQPTGDWEVYKLATVAHVRLKKGIHTLHVKGGVDDGGIMNVRSVSLVPKSGHQGALLEPSFQRIIIPPMLFREFDRGDGVCVEWPNSPGNLGHWHNGEAASFDVEIDKDATYLLSLYFSSPNDGSSLEVSVNGQKTGTVSLPATGEWHKYTVVECGRVSLKAGMNKLTFRSITRIEEGLGNVSEFVLERVN